MKHFIGKALMAITFFGFSVGEAYSFYVQGGPAYQYQYQYPQPNYRYNQNYRYNNYNSYNHRSPSIQPDSVWDGIFKGVGAGLIGSRLHYGSGVTRTELEKGALYGGIIGLGLDYFNNDNIEERRIVGRHGDRELFSYEYEVPKMHNSNRYSGWGKSYQGPSYRVISSGSGAASFDPTYGSADSINLDS